jgi:glycolate oxidase
MINGLEVVLPNGEVCKLGSCAVSDYWFSKGPIPDMIGLFTSSFGTMGIITKLSVKLFPNPKMRDIVFGMATDLKILPKIMTKITYMEFVEDVMIGKSGLSETTKNFGSIMTYITGESQEEMDSKTKIIEGIYKEFNVIIAKLPERNLNFMLARPQFTAVYAADFRKGGGFEYVGSFIPLDKIPEALERGTAISEKYGIIPALLCRLIGSGTVMFSVTFPFNRADPDDMKNARDGLEETNRMVLDIGGIPWKTELTGQKMIMEKIDPNYKKLFTSIRSMLDPNGIMNPGNWEV